jgi:hypothetical protein
VHHECKRFDTAGVNIFIVGTLQAESGALGAAAGFGDYGDGPLLTPRC